MFDTLEPFHIIHLSLQWVQYFSQLPHLIHFLSLHMVHYLSSASTDSLPVSPLCSVYLTSLDWFTSCLSARFSISHLPQLIHFLSLHWIQYLSPPLTNSLPISPWGSVSLTSLDWFTSCLSTGFSISHLPRLIHYLSLHWVQYLSPPSTDSLPVSPLGSVSLTSLDWFTTRLFTGFSISHLPRLIHLLSLIQVILCI